MAGSEEQITYGSDAFAQQDDLDKVPLVHFDLLGYLDFDPAKPACNRFEEVAVGPDAHFDECGGINSPRASASDSRPRTSDRPRVAGVRRRSGIL